MAFRGWLPPCIASCTDSQVQSPVHEREVVAQLLGLVALCSELSLESARMQLRLNALSPVEPIGISAPHTHTHTHTIDHRPQQGRSITAACVRGVGPMERTQECARAPAPRSTATAAGAGTWAPPHRHLPKPVV
jgi:hypothetical protein